MPHCDASAKHGDAQAAPSPRGRRSRCELKTFLVGLPQLSLLSFSCNDILRLRYVALLAKAAFIAYGFTAQLWPVLALHFVLVPVNVWRLVQTRQLAVRRRTSEGAKP